LPDRFTAVANHFPARLKALVRRLTLPRLLLVFAVLIACLSVVTVYYYNEFANEIDARLRGSFLDNSVGIFAAPLKLSAGDRLPIGELTDYLRGAGYQQHAGGSQVNHAGSFEVEGNSILVFPDDARDQNGLNSFRIQIDKNGHVDSLTSPITGERISSAAIEGEMLASVRDGDRRKKIVVQFSDIPGNLRNAIVAAEDHRFFTHNGVDWRGILRALKTDIDQGEFVQGGSTLTQQIIKNDFLSADRTIGRKLKEALMAIILESRLTKEQIFALYCNDVYLGQSGTFAINGFAQAAQVYFDKDLKDLTLSEAAFLAGLICAPNRYSAHRDQARALQRRDVVLGLMVETGAITAEQAVAAKAEPLQIKTHETENDDGASYFIDYAQRFIDATYGSKTLASRERITTTMDLRLQRAAYAAVKHQTEKLDKLFTHSTRKGAESQKVQGALVALDAHTGDVLAMVGGRSYDESQLNRATDAKRQPGSTFKPFVYATALNSRSYTTASLVSDTPQTFSYDGGRSEYKPSDYHGGFTNRSVTLREALTHSLNVPAVQVAMSVGLGSIADLAERCGLDKPRIYPSMALGTSEVTLLELAGAYTTFANQGTALRPIPIRNMSGTDRSIVPVQAQASSTNVCSPQVAYLVTNVLQSVVDEGTASRLRGMGLKGAIAGKTGTTSDGWFVGYTPNIVCAVWVGFDDNRDLRMKAADAALPIWADFMKQALDMRPGLGGQTFPRPGGLVSVDIDPATGCLAGPESTQRRQEIFISGTEPFSNCSQEPTPDPGPVPVSDGLVPVSSSMSDSDAADGDYDQVSVEVCSLTGLIASPDCPKTEKRIFALGKEPIEACRAELHDAERLKGRNPKDEGDAGDRETINSQIKSKKSRVPAPPRFKPPYQ
jgi:penicillin-binding protein 1B